MPASESKHNPYRKKRLPLTLAVAPDRKLAVLGSYVTFKKRYSKGRRMIAGKGSMGIIVKDEKGICGPTQAAVRVAGSAKYYAVPWKRLEIHRGRP